jgi:hypothetical protein
LLKWANVIIPIPGTSTVAHLEENVAAAALELLDAAKNYQQSSRSRPACEDNADHTLLNAGMPASEAKSRPSTRAVAPGASNR